MSLRQVRMKKRRGSRGEGDVRRWVVVSIAKIPEAYQNRAETLDGKKKKKKMCAIKSKSKLAQLNTGMIPE